MRLDLIFTRFAAVVAFLSFLILISKADAHAHHTSNFCSTTATDICAHLGFDAEPNSTDEAIFMLDFAPSKVDPTLITNVTMKIVMDMSGTPNGTRPVTITAINSAHYEISKAYFSMAGPWMLKAGFDFNGASHEVVIPLDVK